ncbi:MAG: hypothetical protein HFH35_14640, partial [Eubacterium sp.]|nr:hypothetical protein [Eubacterium sp.]
MSRNIADQQTRRLARRVLQILEKEDGRSFARKKAEAVKILAESIRGIENQKKQQMTDCPPLKNGAAFFWRQGDLLYADPRILLRRIGECDRGGFLAVRREYTVTVLKGRIFRSKNRLYFCFFISFMVKSEKKFFTK